jgi:hypothetical protein
VARISRTALEELRGKYVEMLSMRNAHEAGGEDEIAVRVRMAALAVRFPGALREIDRLEIAELRRRVDVLGETLRGDREVEPWMKAIGLFHELTRGALTVKRWLGGRKRVDTALQRRFVNDLPTLPFPNDARAWEDELERIASPPRGRVTEAVLSRLAAALGVSVHEARQLLWGARPTDA